MEILDLQQAAAVRSNSRFTMVSAGAGAGKTRVLTERIAYLIEKRKVSPSEILAVTFTRKAATEMARRLRERLRAGLVANLRVGTMHAVALRYIRQLGAGELKLRMNQLTVYNQWETDFLSKDLAKSVKAQSSYRAELERYWDTGEHPKEDSPNFRFWEIWRAILRRNNAMTYGDLILTAIELIPEITRAPLSHVLVDEAQDLNHIQWRFLDLLLQASGAEFFCVGDIDQAIYEWRGALPLRMLTVAEKCEVHTLENNYRSTPAIVVGANQLIEHNENRIPKTMHAYKTECGKYFLVDGIDSKSAALLANKISDQGRIPTAVLSRTHVLLAKISKEMTELNIPHHHCSGDGRIMESETFRRLHAICKLLLNPYDDFSFTLAREVLGIENSEYLRLLTQTEQTPFLAWLESIRPGPADERRGMWKAFFQVGHKWTPQALAGSLLDLVEMQGSIDLDTAERALKFLLAYQGSTLQGYLDWIATYDLQEAVETESDAGIQLMTVHAAKGLEWDNVILVGWNEGILPSRQALDSGLASRLEEERRIAYVAMTRARDTLVITSRPTVTEAKGRTYLNPVSRFIDEIRLAETPNAVA